MSRPRLSAGFAPASYAVDIIIRHPRPTRNDAWRPPREGKKRRREEEDEEEEGEKREKERNKVKKRRKKEDETEEAMGEEEILARCRAEESMTHSYVGIFGDYFESLRATVTNVV
ncbi:hypothetical protein K0M31_020168 [Melipona bicolor]|uniref:Uncharacterized protein n=1 Tax=Melipona bicolor TaxID=60889 RepID=A0AA40G123_9HYME|nr:hypothetical protein K0M31_020168 [Melipona bicolor]